MKASCQICKGYLQKLVEVVSREAYQFGDKYNDIRFAVSLFEGDKNLTNLKWWTTSSGPPACLGGIVDVVDRMLEVSTAASIVH